MEDPIFEREFWHDIIRTPDFKYLFDVFKRHRDKLNKDCLIAVGEGKYDIAGKLRAKAEDMEKIVDLINIRIKEIEKGGE